MFIVQDERPKPTQQFAMRFGAAMDKVSVSRNSKIFSNKVEKEKSYEGQRLPMSPVGMLLWIIYYYYYRYITELERHRDVISHYECFQGTNTNM